MVFHTCRHRGCDLPPEVLDRVRIDSTDEPVEDIRLLCISAIASSCRSRYCCTD
jgi:hypothetical protein